MTKHHSDINIHHDLHKLIKIGEQIMNAIKDFVDAQNAFNDKMDVAIADIQADIKFLQDEIVKLQNGQITAEDQAALDALKARAEAMANKLDAINAMTPPEVPVV